MHEMKLQNKPFTRMKEGYKIIEMRLNDEKRQKIKVRDTITFTNEETNETLLAEVLELYYFNDFYELYDHFDKVSLGYLDDEEALPSDMLKYYSLEQQEKYGVVGIEILAK